MSQSILDQFTIDTILIDPMQDIITKLENKEFRDCDISWLNNKLYKFTKFAAETLEKEIGLQGELVNNNGVLNDQNIKRFIEAFKTLLNYFKSF